MCRPTETSTTAQRREDGDHHEPCERLTRGRAPAHLWSRQRDAGEEHVRRHQNQPDGDEAAKRAPESSRSDTPATSRALRKTPPTETASSDRTAAGAGDTGAGNRNAVSAWRELEQTAAKRHQPADGRRHEQRKPTERGRRDGERRNRRFAPGERRATDRTQAADGREGACVRTTRKTDRRPRRWRQSSSAARATAADAGASDSSRCTT